MFEVFQQKTRKWACMTRILSVNPLIRDGIFKWGRRERDAKLKKKNKRNWWNVLSSPQISSMSIYHKDKPSSHHLLIPLRHLKMMMLVNVQECARKKQAYRKQEA